MPKIDQSDILTLPESVQLKIFSFLDSTDIRAITLTSKKWQNIPEFTSRHMININASQLPFLIKNSKRKYEDVNLCIDIRSQAMKFETYLKEHGQNIKVLLINGELMFLSKVESFLRLLPSIKFLHIKSEVYDDFQKDTRFLKNVSSTLTSILIQNVSLLKRIKSNVTHLTITGTSFSLSQNERYAIIKFSARHNLKSFADACGRVSMLTVLHVIDVSYDYLESLTIHVGNMLPNHEFQFILSLPKLKAFTVTCKRDNLPFDPRVAKSKKLEKLFIYAEDGIWSLEEVELMIKNFPNLKTTNIVPQTSKHLTLMCDVWKHCKILQTENVDVTYLPKIIEKMNTLTDLRVLMTRFKKNSLLKLKLPKLEQLGFVTNLDDITPEEYEQINSNLPSLRKIFLFLDPDAEEPPTDDNLLLLTKHFPNLNYIFLSEVVDFLPNTYSTILENCKYLTECFNLDLQNSLPANSHRKIEYDSRLKVRE